MGRPLNSRYFTQTGIAVKFHNGTTAVWGHIVKQIGSTRFVVSDGTSTKTCLLAQTTGAANTLQPGFCTIVITTQQGEKYVKSLSSVNVVTTTGERISWKKDTVENGRGSIPLASVKKTLGKLARLSVYTGNNLSEWTQFDTWNGRPAPSQVVFFNQSSWANFQSGINYQVNQFAGKSCMWSVPLSAEFGGIPSVVAGTRDSLFTQVAQGILGVAPANEELVVRLGWEMNLLVQEQRAWDTATPPNPIPAAWVNAFRRVVGLFRAVSPRFRFVFCPNNGDLTADGLTVTDCYPGDAYVDYIGPDLYYNDAFSNPAPLAGSDTFDFDRDRSAGLNFWRDFAAARSKPLMIPEWGCNSNLATGWMTSMLEWMKNNNVAFQGYWNSDAAIATKLSTGALPALGAIYRKYEGAPDVTIASTSDSAQNAAFDIPLTSSQDGIYPITWSVVSGPATIVAGNVLRITSAAASTVAIVVRATNGNGVASANFTLNHTFVVPYVFTDADAAAWITARPTSAPSETFKSAVDQLFIALKASTAWSKARDIFISVDTPEASAIGLKRVASLQRVNDPSFVPYEGFTTSFAGLRHLRTTNITSQAPSPATLNSLWLMVWERANVSDNSAALGLPGSNAGVNPRRTDGLTAYAVNDWTTATVASPDARGIYSAIRSTSTARRLRKNSATIHSDTQASATAGSSQNWMIGGDNVDYPASGRQSRIILIGAAPTDTQEADTATAFRNFYAALGKAA